MVARIKSAGLIAAFLVMLFPFLTLAENVNFSVIPAEVHIDNLLPGETTEFKLTVSNKDKVTRVFTLTTFQPPEEERRKGRTEFPDDSWISFSPPDITLGPSSQGNVTVMVAIPQGQKWAGRDWEIWLGVTPESSDLLAAKLYVRLLVSTSGMRFEAGLVAAIAAAIVLLGYGSYHYFKHRAKCK
jgi:hypothetical protein